MIERSFDMVQRAMDTIDDQPQVRFVDYGAADGGTAWGLWRNVAETLGSRLGVGSLEVVINDLPANDWNALASNLERLGQAFPEVTYAMAPRSFYAPVVAPGSVTLGFSATAMHWLSTMPGHLKTHTHANATPNAEDRARFAAVAVRDWEAILLQRAHELRPGGQMVCVNLSRSDDGLYLGHNGRDAHMHDTFHDLWRGLRDEGVITDEEYVGATIQNYYKSEAEFAAPLLDVEGPVHRAGLRLVEIRTDHIACPYRAQFDRTGDLAAFAEGLMWTMRSWSEHTFKAALTERPEEEAQGIVDDFYQRYVDRITAEPGRYSMDYVECYLRLTKEGR
ncbi:MAG: SAM-dependent methyltransferase [Myxococcota bacterium]